MPLLVWIYYLKLRECLLSIIHEAFVREPSRRSAHEDTLACSLRSRLVLPALHGHERGNGKLQKLSMRTSERSRSIWTTSQLTAAGPSSEWGWRCSRRLRTTIGPGPWPVRDSTSSYKIDYVIVIKNFLHPKGHQNRINGSKVTAILLKGWILPIGGASLGEGLHLQPAQQACY